MLAWCEQDKAVCNLIAFVRSTEAAKGSQTVSCFVISFPAVLNGIRQLTSPLRIERDNRIAHNTANTVQEFLSRKHFPRAKTVDKHSLATLIRFCARKTLPAFFMIITRD